MYSLKVGEKNYYVNFMKHISGTPFSFLNSAKDVKRATCLRSHAWGVGCFLLCAINSSIRKRCFRKFIWFIHDVLLNTQKDIKNANVYGHFKSIRILHCTQCTCFAIVMNCRWGWDVYITLTFAKPLNAFNALIALARIWLWTNWLAMFYTTIQKKNGCSNAKCTNSVKKHFELNLKLYHIKHCMEIRNIRLNRWTHKLKMKKKRIA